MTQGPYSPPAASVSTAESAEPSFLKRAGLFVLGAVVFTVIFWTLWLWVLRPGLWGSGSNDSAEIRKQQEQSKAYDDLMKGYQRQAKEADEIQASLKRQVDQADAIQERQMDLLKKQEEQARRFDKILQQWEVQPGGKR